MSEEATAAVRAYWTAIQARDWSAAQALLAPDAVCDWWTSGERFEGAEAIVHVNAVYPEGWSLEVMAVNELVDGRVSSLVRVEQGEQVFYANSFFRLDRVGHIAAIEEFWATVEEPPAWREGLPGRTRLQATLLRRPN